MPLEKTAPHDLDRLPIDKARPPVSGEAKPKQASSWRHEVKPEFAKPVTVEMIGAERIVKQK